jgi:hypothetical protein
VPSFVVVKRPDAYGYETEYLGWMVGRADLLAAADRAGLEREFVAAGAPERPVHLRSFLFRRA